MKKLFFAVVTILVLLVFAAIVAPAFIPADTYKRLAVEKVQAATGRTLAMDHFQVRLFPLVGVTMENATLSNPPGYPDTTPMLAAKSLKIDAALLPLLTGRMEVGEIVLESPDIHLHVAKDGQKNWLLPEKEKSATTGEAEKASANAIRNISLGGLKIKDGAVAYDNEQSNTHAMAKSIDLDVSMPNLERPLSFNGQGEWNGRKVKAEGRLATVQTFLSGGRGSANLKINSELLSLDTDGVIGKDSYSGKLAAKSSSLKSLGQWLEPSGKAAEQGAKLALDLSGPIQCTLEGCRLSGANIALDHLKATGNVEARKGSNGNPTTLGLDLAIDTLDLNPFLPAEHAAASGVITDAFAEEARWSDKPIDLSALKSVNATFRIATGSVLYRKLTTGKTSLQGEVKGGHMQTTINSELYQGNSTVVLGLDAAPVALTSQVILKGVQVKELLMALTDTSRLSGAADVQLNVQSRGSSERQLISALSGTAQVKLAGGAIQGVNLLNMIHNVGTAFAQANNTNESTPISEASGSFTIDQGVVSNKDLTLVLSGLRANGQGEVSLPAWTINYRLTPQITGAREGVAVPVIVEGNLDKPRFRPDVNAIAKEAIQNPDQFKKQLKNTRENFKDQLKNPQDAVKNLKGLLKGF